MAKPIFIIKFPNYFQSEESINEISKQLIDKLQEYHVLCFISDVKDFEFEVLNAENLDPIDIDELKAKVNKLLE